MFVFVIEADFEPGEQIGKAKDEGYLIGFGKESREDKLWAKMALSIHENTGDLA